MFQFIDFRKLFYSFFFIYIIDIYRKFLPQNMLPISMKIAAIFPVLTDKYVWMCIYMQKPYVYVTLTFAFNKRFNLYFMESRTEMNTISTCQYVLWQLWVCNIYWNNKSVNMLWHLLLLVSSNHWTYHQLLSIKLYIDTLT